MFQTNRNRFFPQFVELPVPECIIVPNLAVNVKAAVEKGLVSPLATQPTYGESELSEDSKNGHYVDDPLDMLNRAKEVFGGKVAADSMPLSSDAPKTE